MSDEILIKSEEEASSKADEAEKFLTFFVDEQLFAIPSNHVVEIISMQKITYMPKLPPFVKGVTNIRGKIVPLIELRMRFNKVSIPYDERTCMVITETDDCSIGYIVDKVNDVTDVTPNQISQPPRISDSYAKYITGVAKVSDGIALLLDIAMIVVDENVQEELQI